MTNQEYIFEDFSIKVPTDTILEFLFDGIEDIEISKEQFCEFEDNINFLEFCDMFPSMDEVLAVIEANRIDQQETEQDKEFKKFIDKNKKTKQQIDKATKQIEKDLSLGGFITKTSFDIAKFVASVIKEDGITADSRKQINEYVAKRLDQAVNNIDNIDFDNYYENHKGEFGEDTESNKIAKAVILLIRVLIVNTTAMMVLSILFTPIGGQILTTVLVAPICEEMAKSISVKGNFYKEFAVIFNTYEFSSYVIKFAPQFGVAKVVGLRFMVVGMHLTTTVIHYITNNAQIMQKLGVKDKDDTSKANFAGQAIGILLHMIWNGSAIVSEVIKAK